MAQTMSVNVKMKSYKKEIKKMTDEAKERVLQKWGLKAESNAKEVCPVDTGRLRNSITYKVDSNNKSVEIGSNVKYATKIELGGSKQAPQGYLRPAIVEHQEDYEDIIKSEMNNTTIK